MATEVEFKNELLIGLTDQETNQNKENLVQFQDGVDLFSLLEALRLSPELSTIFDLNRIFVDFEDRLLKTTYSGPS